MSWRYDGQLIRGSIVIARGNHFARESKSIWLCFLRPATKPLRLLARRVALHMFISWPMVSSSLVATMSALDSLSMMLAIPGANRWLSMVHVWQRSLGQHI